MLESDLVRRLRDAATGTRGGREARDGDLMDEAANRIERLQAAVTRYRWERLAKGLVICLLQTHPRGEPTRTHRVVIHRAGCRHIPDTNRAPDRADDKQWAVHPADGISLIVAVEGLPTSPRAKACGTCKPNVDPETVID